jgi:hypothetical protein
MIHKNEHIKRTRAWRRFQEDRVVRKRINNIPDYMPAWWGNIDDCDVEYGDGTIGDVFGTWKEFSAKTSSGDTYIYRAYDKRYRRVKHKQNTKRLLWEENIIQRGGNLRFPPRRY